MKTRIAAIIIALSLTTLATLITACQGSNPTGTWTNTELGVTFELEDKGIANLMDGENAVPGTWSQTGTTIQIKFYEEAVSGTYEGDTLKLNADGDIKVFTRQKK